MTDYSAKAREVYERCDDEDTIEDRIGDIAAALRECAAEAYESAGDEAMTLVANGDKVQEWCYAKGAALRQEKPGGRER